MASHVSKKPYDLDYKLLLVGDSGVGKTCIMEVYADSNFNFNFISTIGVDFKVKTIELERKRIRLQIWDTIGQERFRAISNAYYRGAHGIILVYNITDWKTFASITGWLQTIKTYAPEEVECLLVGNRIDVEHEREVTKEQGREFADRYKIPFLETSAKTNHNIDEAFEMLTRLILKRVPEQKDEFMIRRPKQIKSPEQEEKGGCC